MTSKKKKKPQKTPAAAQKADERVVHAEEMRASIGEILETEHVEEAIDLLYAKEELPAGEAVVEAASDAAVEVKGAAKAAVQDVVEAVKDAAVEINDAAKNAGPSLHLVSEAAPATAQMAGAAATSEPSSSTTKTTPEAAAARALPLWRKLSPVRLVKASWQAAGELKSGVGKAADDLKRSVERARQAFALSPSR
jgi:uncharacterized protein YjbJ (UPF0337 family)